MDKAGSYQIQLVVNDGKENSLPDTVFVSTFNSVPVADAGPDQSGKVGSVLTLNGSDSSDADGDSLSYLWSLLDQPGGSTTSLSDPANVMPTLPLDKSGTYIAQLIVNHGKTDSAPDKVTLSTINSEPVAYAGPDLGGRVGDIVTLDGSASSDVDGDVLTYQWSVTTRPAGSTADVSDATAIRPTLKLSARWWWRAMVLSFRSAEVLWQTPHPRMNGAKPSPKHAASSLRWACTKRLWRRYDP